MSFDIYTDNQEQEKIYIIQPILDENYSHLQKEAVSLIESAGGKYVGTLYQRIRRINPATFIGPGKLTELRNRLDGLGVTVLFNGELTPSQTLNISAALGELKVIDRTTLILDIFARNAKSNEGKLQVELAQLQYNYPRLKGKGSALSRLGGGIGTRGPGETKLETDRRRIRERIDILEKRLAELSNRRALVTHLRCRLKRIRIRRYLICEKLCRGLQRANPAESSYGSKSIILLIVCDATDDYEMQFKTALQTLEDLHCAVPYLLVMNKSEQITEYEQYPSGSIFISAKENKGIDGLKNEIGKFFSKEFTETVLRIPYSRLSEYSRLKKYIIERNISYSDESVLIAGKIDNKYIEKFSPFIE